MRNSSVTSMFLITALFGAPACVSGAVDDAAEQPPGSLPGEGAALSSGLRGHDVVTTDTEVAQAITCPNGFLCLWERVDYEGRRFLTDSWGCQNLPDRFNNATSSWMNRQDRDYFLYAEEDCTGDRIEARRGDTNPDMGYWSNTVSSICRGTSCL